MYGFTISLVNNSSDSVDVLIKDQLPVSTEKTSVVESSELSGGKLSEESGELTWEIKAESKKEIKISVAYSVAWPKDKRLQETRSNIKKRSTVCSKCGTENVTGKFCPTCGSVM